MSTEFKKAKFKIIVDRKEQRIVGGLSKHRNMTDFPKIYFLKDFGYELVIVTWITRHHPPLKNRQY